MSDDKTGLIKRIAELEARLAAAEARIALLEMRPVAIMPPVFVQPSPYAPPLIPRPVICGRGTSVLGDQAVFVTGTQVLS